MIKAHKETFIEFSELGKTHPPYQPTYEGFGNYINEFHRSFATCSLKGLTIVADVPGWLQRGDALKLYEMGYFTDGDILELGCS